MTTCCDADGLVTASSHQLEQEVMRKGADSRE